LKYLLAISLFVCSASSGTEVCNDRNGAEEMYAHFFEIAYDVAESDSDASYIAAVPSEARAEEAWGCLKRAADLGHCPSLHVLELYYRHGVGKKTFGISRDPSKAERYLALKETHCGGD
jgi:TPR repeat protein